MPVARDRLAREEDSIESYIRVRIPRTAGRVGPVIFVLEDDNEAGSTAGTPFRWGGTPLAGSTPQPMRVATGRNAFSASRIVRTPRIRGRENHSPLMGGAHSRGRGSILPSWYPRISLQDITSITRAIERRREREHLRGEGRLAESGPTLQDQRIHDSPAAAPHASLEHDLFTRTPCPKILSKRCQPSIAKVQKILLDIAHESDGDSCSSLTPQKKLLNNFDKVEKVVMDELSRLKRTPSARKAEREQKVRTLMSMR